MQKQNKQPSIWGQFALIDRPDDMSDKEHLLQRRHELQRLWEKEGLDIPTAKRPKHCQLRTMRRTPSQAELLSNAPTLLSLKLPSGDFIDLEVGNIVQDVAAADTPIEKMEPLDNVRDAIYAGVIASISFLSLFIVFL